MKMFTDRIGKRILLLGLGIFAPNLFGAVITSGIIHAPAPFGQVGTFTLSGSDFQVNGAFENLGGWAPYFCYLCDVSALGVDGLVIGNSFLGGSASIGNTAFPLVAFGGLNSAGPSVFTVTGPQIILNGPGSYVAPFSFTGQLCGTQVPGGAVPDPCIVNLPVLTGIGEVTIQVNRLNLPGGVVRLVASDATYAFEVPEPSSIQLVAIALVLLAGRRIMGRYTPKSSG
jgi:hypothetical protein